MNAGTRWGKNTIDPSGRGIEKARKETFFNLLITLTMVTTGILSPQGKSP
jgi:hypothetical protein